MSAHADQVAAIAAINMAIFNLSVAAAKVGEGATVNGSFDDTPTPMLQAATAKFNAAIAALQGTTP